MQFISFQLKPTRALYKIQYAFKIIIIAKCWLTRKSALNCSIKHKRDALETQSHCYIKAMQYSHAI